MDRHRPFFLPYARSRPMRHGAVGVFAAAASVTLHTLVILPVLWGTPNQRKQLPDIQGAAASADPAAREPSMAVVFIQDSNAIHDLAANAEDAAARVLPPAALLPVDVQKTFLSVELDPIIDSQARVPEANADQSGHSMLFGRYMGQITARIERAWLRPRSAIGAGAFVCRVQIKQDGSGFVRDISLQKCNGTPHWQASLIHAIQNASPLPAPPDPAVFSSMLTFEMTSGPFVADSGDQGFEPEARIAVNTAAEESNIRLEALIDQLRSQRDAATRSVTPQ